MLFQSTFPHGERQILQWSYELIFVVSIHVPARGTTPVAIPYVDHYSGFNPRSRTGNDYLYFIR